MKIVARIREPEKITASFKEVVLSKDDRYAEGYDAGMGAANAARDELDASRLTDINTELVKNGTTAADTLDGVDEKIPEVHAAGYLAGGNAGYTAGHRDGEFAGYGRGVAETNEKRDAEIAAELNEINEVIERSGGTKAETLDGVSESVDAAIGAASMKAQTEGYAQGVNDVNAERDVLDVIRLAEINAALTANGGTAADTLDGVDEKIPEVHAAGVKSEYDRFWDTYQENGTATNYNGAFAGARWNDDTFTPKYDIVPSAAQTMFWSSGITDLVGALKKHGVELDFSKCNSFTQTFAYSKMPEIGEVYAIGKYLSATFSNTTYLHTIQKIRVNANTTYNAAFSSATALENITFEGVIAQSGLNFQHSTKLSRASIESIIAALSTTASGKSITLSKTAVNAAFTTDEWNALAGTKTNWTISLV